MLQTKYTDKNNFSVQDDAQVDFKLRGAPAQLKLKQKQITATLDLGQYSKELLKNMTWWNPYVQISNTRDLNKPALYLGHIFTCGNYKENYRMSFSKGERLNVQSEVNFSYKRGDVKMNFYMKNMLSNSIWTSLNRKFNLEYNKKDFHLSLEGVQKSEQSWQNWNMDNVQVGFAYSGVNKATFGVTADVGLSKDNEVTKTVFVGGRLDDNFNYKMKLNDRLDASLFSNMKICSKINLQCSLGANLSNCKNTNGFLGNPFKLGMKVKFNE